MFVQFLAPPSHLKSGMPCPRRPGQLLFESLPKDTSQEPFCDAGPLPVLMDAPSQLTGNSVRQSVETEQRKAAPTAAHSMVRVSQTLIIHTSPPDFCFTSEDQGGGVSASGVALLEWGGRAGPLSCPHLVPAGVSKSSWMPQSGGVEGI